MKLLINTLAGSRLYGIHTPTSDFDTRGVFATENLAEIYGYTQKKTSVKSRNDDCLLWEIVHFFKMLKNGNIHAVEILFSQPDDIIQLDDTFKTNVIEHKYKFLDNRKIIHTILSHANCELSKIDNHIDLDKKTIGEKNKYSFRNAVHCVRLLQCGIWFLQDNMYYVNVMKRSNEFGKLLLNIKMYPDLYTPDRIMSIIEDKKLELEDHLNKNSYNDSKIEENRVLNYIKEIYES